MMHLKRFLILFYFVLLNSTTFCLRTRPTSKLAYGERVHKTKNFYVALLSEEIASESYCLLPGFLHWGKKRLLCDVAQLCNGAAIRVNWIASAAHCFE